MNDRLILFTLGFSMVPITLTIDSVLGRKLATSFANIFLSTGFFNFIVVMVAIMALVLVFRLRYKTCDFFRALLLNLITLTKGMMSFVFVIYGYAFGVILIEYFFITHGISVLAVQVILLVKIFKITVEQILIRGMIKPNLYT